MRNLIDKLRPGRTFLASTLGLLLVFSCSKDNSKDNGTPTVIKHALTITKPTNGTLVSDPAGINCGRKGDDCEAEFEKGTEVTLTAKADAGYVLGAWQGACDKTDADQPCKLVMDTDMAAGLTLAIDPNDIDGDGEPNETDVDDDNDGLIEIHNLDMFNHIRYNLAGTAYKAGSSATASIVGAPTGSPTANCKTATDGVYLCGYELMRDLDFNEDSSYASGSTNKSVWQPDDSNPDRASNAGFEGIEDGFGEEGFPSIFEGNGYTISNFYSRNTDSMSPGDGEDGKPRARVGLFKSIEANATIRNLGVVNARLYGSAFSNEQIGSLVGKNKGKIIACHATGETNGGKRNDFVGGLVGTNTAGAIIDSHATVAVNGGTGKDRIGGLVGYNNKGSIRNSYATGAVSGGDGNDRVGGLVGSNIGSITASYATGGTLNGGSGDDLVGGLAGSNYISSITASYATRDVNGNAGYDRVGGLVGNNQRSRVVASYATGVANGGDRDNDFVGGLLGNHQNSTVVASYATGAVSGGGGNDSVGGLVGYMDVGTNRITASYATGDVDSGTGSGNIGILVGFLGTSADTITHSYGFGSGMKVGRGNDGTAHPAGLGSISDKAEKVNALTIGTMANTDVNASWNNAAQKTLDAWDFTAGKPPALKYADYDGAGSSSVDYCALFPAKIPGTDTNLACGSSLLPGQGR